ncbi:hypothetical protein C2845_PM15G17840 [Panicum miliaceum]|uniref:Uncharacterized protein n=1 Tax=Panicum miliaceum TaxID=4540 RepID=A0A3L6Q7M4_PANMI|nr:hypothetical protein C2845_PM15G17840 [Panicum miliaceum]
MTKIREQWRRRQQRTRNVEEGTTERGNYDAWQRRATEPDRGNNSRGGGRSRGTQPDEVTTVDHSNDGVGCLEPRGDAPEVGVDGHGDDDEEEEENNEEDGDNRGRRLSWIEAGDIRLVSAWLNNSVDPLVETIRRVKCTGRKSVTAEYNSNNPPNRRRQPNQSSLWKGPMPCTNRKQSSVSLSCTGGNWRETNQSGPGTTARMYYDTQALRASTVEKTADVQLWLSREKLEAAQTRERTSKADLSGMTDMQRAEHQRALQYYGDKVYGAYSTD